jgi:hypothetical protein
MYCKLLHLGPRELDWDGRFCGGRLLMVKRGLLGLSGVSLFGRDIAALRSEVKRLINSHGG